MGAHEYNASQEQNTTTANDSAVQTAIQSSLTLLTNTTDDGNMNTTDGNTSSNMLQATYKSLGWDYLQCPCCLYNASNNTALVCPKGYNATVIDTSSQGHRKRVVSCHCTSVACASIPFSSCFNMSASLQDGAGMASALATQRQEYLTYLVGRAADANVALASNLTNTSEDASHSIDSTASSSGDEVPPCLVTPQNHSVLTSGRNGAQFEAAIKQMFVLLLAEVAHEFRHERSKCPASIAQVGPGGRNPPRRMGALMKGAMHPDRKHTSMYADSLDPRWEGLSYEEIKKELLKRQAFNMSEVAVRVNMPPPGPWREAILKIQESVPGVRVIEDYGHHAWSRFRHRLRKTGKVKAIIVRSTGEASWFGDVCEKYDGRRHREECISHSDECVWHDDSETCEANMLSDGIFMRIQAYCCINTDFFIKLTKKVKPPSSSSSAAVNIGVTEVGGGHAAACMDRTDAPWTCQHLTQVWDSGNGCNNPHKHAFQGGMTTTEICCASCEAIATTATGHKPACQHSLVPDIWSISAGVSPNDEGAAKILNEAALEMQRRAGVHHRARFAFKWPFMNYFWRAKGIDFRVCSSKPTCRPSQQWLDKVKNDNKEHEISVFHRGKMAPRHCCATLANIADEDDSHKSDTQKLPQYNQLHWNFASCCGKHYPCDDVDEADSAAIEEIFLRLDAAARRAVAKLRFELKQEDIGFASNAEILQNTDSNATPSNTSVNINATPSNTSVNINATLVSNTSAIDLGMGQSDSFELPNGML